MNCLLRGIIGGLRSGVAPRPSGGGSTRRPDRSGFRGGGLSAASRPGRSLYSYGERRDRRRPRQAARAEGALVLAWLPCHRDTARAMSQNVELLYRCYDAFSRRDLDAYLALVDPEWNSRRAISQLEGGSVYRGHDGVRVWWRTLFAVFPDFSSEVLEVREPRRDSLIVSIRVRGHGVEGGVPFEEVWLAGNPWRVTARSTWCAELRNRGRSPRSRWAVGVGDVAGERGDRASRLRGVERGGHGGPS